MSIEAPDDDQANGDDPTEFLDALRAAGMAPPLEDAQPAEPDAPAEPAPSPQQGTIGELIAAVVGRLVRVPSPAEFYLVQIAVEPEPLWLFVFGQVTGVTTHFVDADGLRGLRELINDQLGERPSGLVIADASALPPLPRLGGN